MSKDLNHLLLDAPFLRNFTYGDRVIVGTIADEFDVIIKNHAETLLDANQKHIGEKGVIVSCLSDRFGLIARFNPPESLREQADGVQSEVHTALSTYNPLDAIVVMHVGWDNQSHTEAISLARLERYAARNLRLSKSTSDILILPA